MGFTDLPSSISVDAKRFPHLTHFLSSLITFKSKLSILHPNPKIVNSIKKSWKSYGIGFWSWGYGHWSNLEQSRTAPNSLDSIALEVKTIFRFLLKHNDNFPLSIRANAGKPHSAHRYRRTPDNINNRHQFKCFKSYRLNEKLWSNNSNDDRRKHHHDIYYLQVKGNIITESWAAHFLLL